MNWMMYWSLGRPVRNEIDHLGMWGNVCLNTTMFNFTVFRPTRNASGCTEDGRDLPLRISRTLWVEASIETLTRLSRRREGLLRVSRASSRSSS